MTQHNYNGELVRDSFVVDYKANSRSTVFRAEFIDIYGVDPFIDSDFDGFIGLVPKGPVGNQGMSLLNLLKIQNKIDRQTVSFYIRGNKGQSLVKFGSYDQ